MIGPKDPLQTQCPTCEGSGQVALGEHFVSRYMAMDACEPSMEGMSMGIEYGPCPDCGGTGLLSVPV